MTRQTYQPPYFCEEDAISLPDNHQWTPQEHWAWANIVRGEIADMSNFDLTLNRANDFAAWIKGNYDGASQIAVEETGGSPTPWPTHRQLSAAFLRLIAFHRAYEEARSRRWVRIRFAEFIEPIDLANGILDGDLWLDDCRFDQGLVLNGLHVVGTLSLDGSHVAGELRAEGIVVGGSMACTSGFTAEDSIRIVGGKISGQLSFSGATLHGPLSADGLVVEGGLFCLEGFVAKDELRLMRANIGVGIYLTGATLEKGFVADSISIDGAMFCDGAFVAKKNIRLLNANIRGVLNFIGATLEERLDADGIQVQGGMFLREMKRLGSADFIQAQIPNDVQLSDSLIDGVVDFTGASISGELQTSQEAASSPQWGNDSRLILRNATIGTLAGGVESFPKARKSAPPPMELSGLTYDRLGGLGASENRAGGLSEATSGELIRWLKAGHATRDFTPGPYRQLAAALVAAGHAGKANNILHAMRKHERDCEKFGWRKVGLFFSGVAIGFGYRNHYAAYWFALIVLAFAVIGLNWHGIRPIDLSVNGWNKTLHWLGFSFGNSVPLIQLDKAHETFLAVEFVEGAATDPERFVHAVPVPLAWTFYVQKALGFAVLSFLAAGLTGAATRQRE